MHTRKTRWQTQSLQKKKVGGRHLCNKYLCFTHCSERHSEVVLGTIVAQILTQHFFQPSISVIMLTTNAHVWHSVE